MAKNIRSGQLKLFLLRLSSFSQFSYDVLYFVIVFRITAPGMGTNARQA